MKRVYHLKLSLEVCFKKPLTATIFSPPKIMAFPVFQVCVVMCWKERPSFQTDRVQYLIIFWLKLWSVTGNPAEPQTDQNSYFFGPFVNTEMGAYPVTKVYPYEDICFI